MNASHSCGCGRPAPAWRPRPATPPSRRPSRIDPVRLDRATLARLRAELGPQANLTFRTAVEALQHNKLRASLTSLGILFGVASVIAMLAIGKGAEREILEQLRLLGSNTLRITPLVQQQEGPSEERSEKEVKKFAPGLTYADAEAIGPGLTAVVGACG